jgi:Zn-dependent metalloprotease
VLSRKAGGKPDFLTGDLGSVKSAQQGLVAEGDDRVFREAVVGALHAILSTHVGLTGQEDFRVVKVGRDRRGNAHVRVTGTIDGIPVELASTMVHVSSNGTIVAVNGELVSALDVNTNVELTCQEAFEVAMRSVLYSDVANSAWIEDVCDLTFVQASDGTIYKAWARTLQYERDDHPVGKLQQAQQRIVAIDRLYASAVDGKLVAAMPSVRGLYSLRTLDCHTAYDEASCTLVSSSSAPIATSDYVANAAHNLGIQVLDFFKSEWNRNSFDDNGATLVSRVHVGANEANAYFDGTGPSYGDGDGVNVLPLALSQDVVCHEISHGITRSESSLVYAFEGGALDEALSDIMAATMSRVVKGATSQSAFLIGEDVFVADGAVRSLLDPANFSGTDFYSERYIGMYPTDGVHPDSGIASLAFALMTAGGTHPRNKTSVVVPAIDTRNLTKSMRIASSFFYDANVNCLTPASDFLAARRCTIQAAEMLYPSIPSYRASVAAAWSAVGLTEEMENAVELTDGVPLLGQAAGVSNQVKHYYLPGVVYGETVTCSIAGSIGDANLYVSTNGFAHPSTLSPVNSCTSDTPGSNEQCTTFPVTLNTASVYVAVKASTPFSGLSVTCAVNDPPIVSVVNGSPLGNQVLPLKNSVRFYKLSAIRAGDQVSVSLSGGTAGDADLYVAYGRLPKISDGTWDFRSWNLGSSELCSFTSVSDSDIYIMVHAYSSNSSYKVSGRSSTSGVLKNGVATTTFSSTEFGRLQDFRLSGIPRGYRVSCNLIGGADGDADLFVRFGSPAETSTASTVNACTSARLGNSIEACTTTTGAATANAVAFASVYTKSPFSSLSLKCSTVCTALNKACLSTDSCCRSTTSSPIVCEGATAATKTCKYCRPKGQLVSRPSQCCSGKWSTSTKRCI